MKVLIYFDGLNQLDDKGSAFWNLSISICKYFARALQDDAAMDLKIIVPASAVSLYSVFKNYSQEYYAKTLNTTGDLEIVKEFFSKTIPYSISDEELRNCFNKYVSLGEIYRKSLERSLSAAEFENLSNLIRGKLHDWEPDLVISYPLPLPFLKEIFKNAMVVVNEWGFFSRPPLPRTIYFDPVGSIDNSFLNMYKNEIRSFPITEKQDLQVEMFKREFTSLMESKLIIRGTIFPYKQRWNKLVLVPLTNCSYTEGINPFPDDANVIQYVMERVPQDIGVIFTGHPGADGALSTSHVYDYTHRYSNFIFLPQLRKFPMPSVALFPYVDAVINHISQTGVMAMLWDIPIIPLCVQYNDWIKDGDSLDDLSAVLSAPRPHKNNIIYWYLTHYLVFEKRFGDSRFYHDFFTYMLDRYRNGGLSFDVYKKIESFEDISAYILATLGSKSILAQKKLPTPPKKSVGKRIGAEVGRGVRKFGNALNRIGQYLIDVKKR